MARHGKDRKDFVYKKIFTRQFPTFKVFSPKIFPDLISKDGKVLVELGGVSVYDKNSKGKFYMGKYSDLKHFLKGAFLRAKMLFQAYPCVDEIWFIPYPYRITKTKKEIIGFQYFRNQKKFKK